MDEKKLDVHESIEKLRERVKQLETKGGPVAQVATLVDSLAIILDVQEVRLARIESTVVDLMRDAIGRRG